MADSAQEYEKALQHLEQLQVQVGIFPFQTLTMDPQLIH